MEQHEVINLYLDNDVSGQNCSRHSLLNNEKYKDKSNLYQHYKDLNEWTINIGKVHKESLKL